MITFVSDSEHYSKVLKLAAAAKKTLWLGTADLKDLYVERGRQAESFLALLSEMLGRGVAIRLLHAKEPGPNFRADFDRYPRLAKMLERAMCPRVHFKIIVIDQIVCYIGSANLTGAAMGMKADTRRNFESGIVTDEAAIVAAAAEEFDKVWRGSECRKCKRREFCGDPIV